jgi:hypothetical protein
MKETFTNLQPLSLRHPSSGTSFAFCEIRVLLALPIFFRELRSRRRFVLFVLAAAHGVAREELTNCRVLLYVKSHGLKI